MVMPDESISDKLKSIINFREKAEVMTCAQLKAEIQSLDNACKKWDDKKSKVGETIAISIAGIFSALISSQGFAEAVKDVNLVRMWHLSPIGTIAVFIVMICFPIYTHYRSYKLESDSKRRRLITYLLEKIE